MRNASLLQRITLATIITLGIFQGIVVTPVADASVWHVGSGIWAIDTGGWRLDLYGKCRNMANTCGATLMIPGGSDAQWTSFITGKPGCVNIYSECCSAWSNLGTSNNGETLYNSADGYSYTCSCS